MQLHVAAKTCIPKDPFFVSLGKYVRAPSVKKIHPNSPEISSGHEYCAFLYYDLVNHQNQMIKDVEEVTNINALVCQQHHV